MVYQRLIDNRCSQDLVEDIRLPFVCGAIPLVYVKRRPLARRFKNLTTADTVVRPEAVLSADEIASIRRFCDIMGLDYGELDVLRDRGNGRIYIVDANKTPYGPSRVLSVREAVKAMQIIADAFNGALSRYA
jgi:glutathione synthase/RimK-type ligase-like ATP-grasp enzyme